MRASEPNSPGTRAAASGANVVNSKGAVAAAAAASGTVAHATPPFGCFFFLSRLFEFVVVVVAVASVVFVLSAWQSRHAPSNGVALLFAKGCPR